MDNKGRTFALKSVSCLTISLTQESKELERVHFLSEPFFGYSLLATASRRRISLIGLSTVENQMKERINHRVN
jgi:hypothetical protein